MADFLSIDIRGEREIEAFFRRVPEAVSNSVLMTGMMAGALPAQNRIKELAPWRTGTYRRRIHIGKILSQLAVQIGTSHPGAAMQEYGGVVVPKKAKALHFFVDGEEVFTKGPVHIPAHPHFRPGFNESKPTIVESVRDAIRAQIRMLVR